MLSGHGGGAREARFRGAALTTDHLLLVASPITNTAPTAGPGYRNVVGLPGGVSSPYFRLLQDANVNGMELREGKGNVYEVRHPGCNAVLCCVLRGCVLCCAVPCWACVLGMPCAPHVNQDALLVLCALVCAVHPAEWCCSGS